jgi:hypothetical protein
MPAIASSSSDWPLPATPAMPTISPARISKETSSTMVTPRLSAPSGSHRELRPRRLRFAFSTRSSTRRPTISSASSSTVVSEVVRVATISPRRMTETSSVIAMISRSLWVMRMTRFALVLQLAEDAEQVVGLGSASARPSARRE